MRNIKNDLAFGKVHEKKCMDHLNKINLFGQLTLTDTYNDKENFDMFNDNFFIEHKQRNIYGTQFPTLVFDYVKWRRHLELKQHNPKLRFFVIWSCKDDRYIWELDESKWDTEIFVKRWLNQDRGKGYLQDTDVCEVKIQYIQKLSQFSI